MTSSAPFIPDNAPFSNDQRAWLNGFLAGLFSSGEETDAAASGPVTAVTILVGSQTGTAEGVAKKAAKQLKASRCEVTVKDMGDCQAADLAGCENLLLITSTYGEGDPPDNAKALYDQVMGEGAPSLEGVRFAVLGLGDSSYADFCQCSRDFDRRLEELGATRFAPTVECDVDPDEPFAKWMEGVKPALAPSGESSAGAADSGEEEDSEEAAEWSRKNPFPAKLLRTFNLNAEGSGKQTHHVEISLEGSGLSYEVGDALGVMPENDPRVVDDLLEAAGFGPEELAPMPHGEDRPVFEALQYHYDIHALTGPFLQACARLSKNEDLRAMVRDEERMKAYLADRQIIDPIVEFGIKFPTTEYLIAPLKQLQPRLYSISSSPRAHPGEVHLTVGRVSYELHGRPRLGVCSNFLAHHGGDRPVPVYLHANKNFRLPEDGNLPVIMIGPGTGIAPFRAFLEERQAAGAKGKNWLFFGDRQRDTDFLYREQIENWQKEGHLNRLDLAFSRDQKEKIYVQHLIEKEAQEIFAWLEEGASVYVCGDASRMARDVDDALHQVVRNAGGKSEEEAADYMANLKKEKRYQRDVY
ncbi:MAG: sulfite reductase subunit alpha [Opitutales bacterium]|nr:sulfite reductase subunit alpha [Opitutales bacterium]MCH8540514.1 sulfite reductase subunit alpha [Opitutales bacterium]